MGVTVPDIKLVRRAIEKNPSLTIKEFVKKYCDKQGKPISSEVK